MKKLLHLLSITAILALLSTNAYAQSGTTGSLGDGDDPYLGSTHNYKVTKNGGTSVWTVFESDGTTAATAKVTLGATGNDNIDITWNTAGDYVIEYTETLNGCSTKRTLGITVRANSFHLDLAADYGVCNSEEGNVLDWSVYETKSDVKTELTFTVNMTKDSGFSIDTYNFTGNFVLPGGVSIAAASDVTVTGGTKMPPGTVNGNFNVSATALVTSLGETVTIKVQVSGKVTDGGAVTLNLTNGKAVKGTAVTPDNTALPASSDRAQVVTLKPLAGSSNISF